MTEPRTPTIADVRAAAGRIDGLAVRTALIRHPHLDDLTGARVFLKPENLQRVGAFKFRGAYNKIAQIDHGQSPGGVVACSSGNHAQGVAEAARLCGLASTIVMPRDAPRIKVARTRRFGGEVVFYDREREDRDAIALALCKEQQAAFVHPYDDPDVVAGQGTIGLEIADDLSKDGIELDALLVPCSGGGLASGVSIAIKDRFPAARIHSVEPEGFDDMARSLQLGSRQRNSQMSGSIADALMAPSPGLIPFKIARENFAEGLVVSDDDARHAVRYACNELKVVLEPGGAVALAALLAAKADFRGKTVVVVMSGGNIEPEQLQEILASERPADD